MRYHYMRMLVWLLCALAFSSCLNLEARKTTLEVEDNKRHYYPILAGQQKDISFMLKNTGEHPLMITDIITSCGCLKVNDDSKTFTVPPGKERPLTLRYNSAKNVGYVKHYITLYGNFEQKNIQEIEFDIHVVPNAMYTKDYEELYKEEMDARGGLEALVDGDENNKGYYMDEDFTKSVHEPR